MRLTAAAALAGTIVVGAWAAVAAPASGGSQVAGSQRHSLECHAYVHGVTPRGVPVTFRYDDGTVVNESRGPDALGYQPRDLAYPHYAGAGLATAAHRAARITSYWFTLSGNQLSEVTEVDRRDKRGVLVSAEYFTRVVRKNWAGARQISIGEDRDYLYALTNTDQLLRYRLTGKDGNTNAVLDQVVGVGFAAIGTWEYTRSFTDDAGARSDVFLATDADSGELLEFTIPQDDPTSYTRTVLQETGWTDLRSAGRLASCLNPTSGRSYDGIVGVDLEGTVRLWTDRDSRDGLGDDIVGRGVLKDAWKPMAYGD
jgi:hypothetical protein